MDRRDFLKQTAVAAAMLSASGLGQSPDDEKLDKENMSMRILAIVAASSAVIASTVVGSAPT